MRSTIFFLKRGKITSHQEKLCEFFSNIYAHLHFMECLCFTCVHLVCNRQMHVVGAHKETLQHFLSIMCKMRQSSSKNLINSSIVCMYLSRLIECGCSTICAHLPYIVISVYMFDHVCSSPLIHCKEMFARFLLGYLSFMSLCESRMVLPY